MVRRVELMGDIHCEEAALRAVLAHLRDEHVDRILAVGDVVKGREDVVAYPSTLSDDTSERPTALMLTLRRAGRDPRHGLADTAPGIALTGRVLRTRLRRFRRCPRLPRAFPEKQ
ncbi:MAG: hypothetical protein JST54_10020 [Deltaproteobacteria bacterium]|nr:hypothetical protein [Deltaproteobacteria bacterium]